MIVALHLHVAGGVEVAADSGDADPEEPSARGPASPDVLGNLHGAKVWAAHGAEVSGFRAFRGRVSSWNSRAVSGRG